jgi:hypothetical protein
MTVQDGNMTRIIMPDQTVFLKNQIPRRESSSKKKENPSHGQNDSTFGIVYANDLAKAKIEKENPDFPAGSIIVREKNQAIDSLIPQTVIAMVKREKGFSKQTGDWEFFVFDGADLKIERRETKGDCAKCHASAAKTDWVFRDYLK